MNSRLERVFTTQNANNEQSQNFCNELLDVNSRSKMNNIMREQSMNMRIYFTNDYQRELPGDDISDLEAGNAVNFWQASKQNYFNQTGSNKVQGEPQFQKIQQIDGLDSNKKKGLKFLAWIINRLLRKRKYENNQIVNQCINHVLAKEGQNANYQKEAQNIRRRIYDAINVMGAIGLVNRTAKSQIYITKPDIINPMCHNKIINLLQKQNKQEIINQDDGTIQSYLKIIQRKKQNIQIKKKFIEKAKQKILALKNHLQRNQKFSSQTNSNQIQVIDVQKQKQDIQILSQQNEKVYFPFVMIGAIGQQISIECHGKLRKQVRIKHKKNQILFYSQLDAVYNLHQKSIKNQKILTKQNYKMKPNDDDNQQQSQISEMNYFQVLDQQLPNKKQGKKKTKLNKTDKVQQKYSTLIEITKNKERSINKVIDLSIKEKEKTQSQQQILLFDNQNSRNSRSLFQRFVDQKQQKKQKKQARKQKQFNNNKAITNFPSRFSQ